MIAIGGSLGGFAALREILIRLPRSFALPIAVVLHRHRDSRGLLLPPIQEYSPLPVSEVEDKDAIQPGRLYLCPPDYHLLVERDYFSLSMDEPVSHARPSIDFFFESVADWQGPNAIAVVLTGSGSDGARGARRIADLGGTVLVQDPKTAEGPWMPTAAIAAVPKSTVLSLAAIAEKLVQRATLRLPTP